jgi:N-acetylglucosamine malate deacetylase 2
MTRRSAVSDVWRRLGSPSRAVAVVAHPDDESFGLGAVIAALVDAGTSVAVVCLTRGEASTLGAVPDLGDIRDRELHAAAAELGVEEITVFDHQDGDLAGVDADVLLAEVVAAIGHADLVLAFEPGGVTGHPDHRAATAVAWRAACRLALPIVEWGVSDQVAAALRTELGAPFGAIATRDGELLTVDVDRSRQLAAIACHASQATDNPVLRRRLALQGPCEHVVLHRPPEGKGGVA